jgi:hypothetical protein
MMTTSMFIIKPYNFSKKKGGNRKKQDDARRESYAIIDV